MDVLDFPIDRRGRPDGRDEGPCPHRTLELDGLVADVCEATGSTTWSGDSGPLDPAEAVARLFGDFDLRAAVPAIRAPGPTVVTCTPASRRGREVLAAFPADRWLEAMPSLWMRSAEHTLLLSPTDPGLTDRLLHRIGG